MEISHIPRPVWHALGWSLSFAILVLSASFAWITYHSSSISVEIANAKITVVQAQARTRIAIAETTQIAKALKRQEQERMSATSALREEFGALGTKMTAASIERLLKTVELKILPMPTASENLDRIISELENVDASLFDNDISGRKRTGVPGATEAEPAK